MNRMHNAQYWRRKGSFASLTQHKRAKRIEAQLARSASLGSLTKAQQQEEVGKWMEEAVDALNKYKLVEAEDLFWKILEHSSDHKQHDKFMVQCLNGLTEVYTKRGRTMRHNEMEWHRMYMHAITSQRKSLECAKHALVEPQDNQLASWFQDQVEKGEINLKNLEDSVVKSLKDHLVSKEKSEKDREGRNIDAQWLGGLQRYCKDRLEKGIERFGSKENLTSLLDDEEAEPEESKKEEKPKPPPRKKKKINYAKVQDAIQNLVKQISGEMRHRHMHQRLTQRALNNEEYKGKILTPEERLKCDTMSLIKPLSESLSVLHEFEEAFEEQQSLSPKESANSGDKYDELSPMSETAAEFESQTGSDVMEIEDEVREVPMEELKAEVPAPVEEEEPAAQETSWSTVQTVQDSGWKHGYGRREKTITFRRGQAPVTTVKSYGSYVSEPPKPSPPSPIKSPVKKSPEKEDDDRVIKGVLRVWKGYKSEQPEMTLPLSPYKLESFEELSPLTEILKVPHSQFAGKPGEEDELEHKMPVSEMSLNVTFALTLSKLADQMKDVDKLEEASDLYKCALGIMLKNRQDSNRFVAHVVHILLNLGMIKCQRGDFTGGSQLIEECIHMYEGSNHQDAKYHVARLWYELGNVYMMEQSRESTLFEHVMRTVREELTNEVRKELGEIQDDVSDDEDEDSEGQSYWVSAQEALNCFNNSVEILRQHNLANVSDAGNILYVKVLTKLGDCNIMTGDHDRAIMFYEEALYLFRNSIGSAALPTNAHVLAMLGTANYMLGQYHKAVSMFETGHILQQHLYGLDDATFEVAFTLTMLGLSYYNMKHYHKCIAWCLKGFELYSCIYKSKFETLSVLYRWFITQTLYTLGFSYGTLNFHDKCLYYLKLSLTMSSTFEDADAKQKVRILKAIGDEYTAIDQSDSGLEYYTSALELSESLGTEESATALQNQLLNRMAGVHVNAKDYGTAAQYLQQALDHQKNVEHSIKDDLIGILKQLGMTYALAGDVDRAIECYTESVEAYEEISGASASEIALTLGSLATLYHVKACIQDDTDEMNNLLDMAERCYHDAVTHDSRSSVCVQYANYLYQQELWSDALIVMLPIVHIKKKHLSRENNIIQYNGVEQAILPEHITSDIDDYDEVTLETKIFAKFLAILCYKQLNLMKDAEDVMIDLYNMVDGSTLALNYSILGYALLEMYMFEEAAECFNKASSMEPNKEIPFINCWITLCLWAYTTMQKGVDNVLEILYRKMQPERTITPTKYKRPKEMPQPVTQLPPKSPKLHRSPLSPSQRAKFGDKKHGAVIAKPVIVKPVTRRHISESSDGSAKSPEQANHEETSNSSDYVVEHHETVQKHVPSTRDSGYYDHGNDEKEIPWGSHESIPEERLGHKEELEKVLTWRTTSEPLTKSSIIEQALKAAREKRERSASVEKETKPEEYVDRGYNSNENLEKQGLEEKKLEDTYQTWQEEEVVETPAAILEALRGGSINKTGGYEKEMDEGSSETGTFTNTDGGSESNYASSDTYTVTEPTDEVWHTDEIVVETPMAIVQAIRMKQELDVETEYEKYKREEKERKERLEQQRAERKREQERQERESQAAWQRVEETVETSLNLLEALRTKREKSRSRETLDGQDTTQPEEDNWTITEEVVETPMAILQALSDAKKVLGESLGLDESEIERIASGGSITAEPPPDEELQDQEETWQVYEEEVETPMAILHVIQQNKPQLSESTPEDETYSSWTTSEEVVSTPAVILNSISHSEDDHMNGVHPDDAGHATDEDDYDQERIWVTEEVIETPIAILQAISHSDSNDSHNRDRNDKWTVEETVTKPVIYDSWRTENSHRSSSSYSSRKQHNEQHTTDNGHYRPEPGYYNSRSSYSSYSSSQNAAPEPEPEETWQVWESEETVETPPEILALLRSQQVQ